MWLPVHLRAWRYCRSPQSGKKMEQIEHLCLVFSIATIFVAPVQNLAWGGVFKLKDGYPVFRFVKDVVVNNQEVLDEQARMAELSTMKDTWNVLAVKPKYHTYVVVIGESARRDAMGAFGGHWDNTPFAVRSMAPVYRLCGGQRLDAEITWPDAEPRGRW
jgi:glucan phosphoethanolaminetransferase (alkaline phosphatase superfamily)